MIDHLSFGIHLLALGTCWASILVSWILFKRWKKPLIKQFGLFISSLFLIMTALGILEYSQLTGVSFERLSLIFNAVGSSMLVIVTPFFFHELFGIPFGKRENIIFGTVDLVLILSAFLLLFDTENVVVLGILQALLFGTLGYGIVRGALSGKNLGNRSIRTYLRTLMITSLIAMPFIAADSIFGELPFLPNNLALPLFVLVVAVQALFFILNTAEREPFLKAGELTGTFLNEYGLTEREGEIVASLLKGQSNREIGEECFISVKTVENHLSAVYQKCDVKNRAQLVNLIRTNAAL